MIFKEFNHMGNRMTSLVAGTGNTGSAYQIDVASGVFGNFGKSLIGCVRRSDEYQIDPVCFSSTLPRQTVGFKHFNRNIGNEHGVNAGISRHFEKVFNAWCIYQVDIHEKTDRQFRIFISESFYNFKAFRSIGTVLQSASVCGHDHRTVGTRI